MHSVYIQKKGILKNSKIMSLSPSDTKRFIPIKKLAKIMIIYICNSISFILLPNMTKNFSWNPQLSDWSFNGLLFISEAQIIYLCHIQIWLLTEICDHRRETGKGRRSFLKISFKSHIINIWRSIKKLTDA